jgi:hypothetical protein
MAVVARASVDLDDQSLDLKTRFEAFKTQFEKTYTADEEEAAFNAFSLNDQKIQKYNSQDLTYTLGHNEWSDMTEEEFNSVMLSGYNPNDDREKDYDYSLSESTEAPPHLQGLDHPRCCDPDQEPGTVRFLLGILHRHGY